MASKVNINDFNRFLSQKANIADVSTTFEQIAT